MADIPTITISQHAIEQFKKRSGSKKSPEALRTRLQDFLSQATQVKPIGNYGAVQLLNHGLRPATYYSYGSWILVVEGSVLKTIHENESKRFGKKYATQ